MITITTEQARKRFSTLPPTLQDALFSEQTAEIISSTAEKFNLAEDRAESLPGLVGWVLLGFLHIEDLAAEIETAARVPKPLAKEIADSLNIKIFEPLRGTLAQFHAPVPDAITGIETAPTRVEVKGMTAAPKIIGDTTFTATPGSQKNVIIGPKVMTEVRPAGSAPTSTSTATQPGLAPKPQIPGDLGKPIQHFDAKPNIGSALASPTAPSQKPKSSGEFARLAAQQGAPAAPAPIVKPLIPVTPTTPAPKPITPSTPTVAAAAMPVAKPMMLQNSSLPKPIQNAPDLNNPQKAVDILSGKKMSVPLPIKPAVIEIGNKPMGTPSAPTPSRNVNYSAIPSQATNTGNRQITEITSQAPTQTPNQPRPIAPAPLPTQSQTPQNAAPGPTKPAGLSPIIVKNFTEGEK